MITMIIPMLMTTIIPIVVLTMIMTRIWMTPIVINDGDDDGDNDADDEEDEEQGVYDDHQRILNE